MNNKVKEVKRIAKRIRKKLEKLAGKSAPDLCGWCAFSSHIIFNILKKKGYSPTFCANSEHAFLYWRGYYIDVTITQFGVDYPKVWFKKVGDENWHIINRKTRSEKKIWKSICKDWNRPYYWNDRNVQNILKSA